MAINVNSYILFLSVNTLLHIRYWYEHVAGPDGKVHWKIYKHDIKYEVEKGSFRLDNLLNDKNFSMNLNYSILNIQEKI